MKARREIQISSLVLFLARKVKESYRVHNSLQSESTVRMEFSMDVYVRAEHNINLGDYTIHSLWL